MTRAAVSGFCKHRSVALNTRGPQSLGVVFPQLFLLRAEEVQVVPRIDAGVMAVGKARLNGVIADWLQTSQVHQTFARLKGLLSWPMPRHFS